MKAPSPLNARELDALQIAKANGGRLVRDDSVTLWTNDARDITDGEAIVAHDTVRKLIARGLLKVTKDEERRGGTYPVEVTVIGGQA